MSGLHVESFAFECGDLVIHRSAEHLGKGARRFVVIERRVNECSRGWQISYSIRGGGDKYGIEAITPLYYVNEIELVLASHQEAEETT